MRECIKEGTSQGYSQMRVHEVSMTTGNWSVGHTFIQPVYRIILFGILSRCMGFIKRRYKLGIREVSMATNLLLCKSAIPCASSAPVLRPVAFSRSMGCTLCAAVLCFAQLCPHQHINTVQIPYILEAHGTTGTRVNCQ